MGRKLTPAEIEHEGQRRAQAEERRLRAGYGDQESRMIDEIDRRMGRETPVERLRRILGLDD